MSYPKPQKKCKYCNKDLPESVPTKVAPGMSKFCNLTCASNHWANKPSKTELPETFISKSVKRFKQLLTTDNPLSKGIKKEKEIFDRDEDFLNFVRNIPCIICGAGNSHAHHVDTGGTGVKGSDYSCIPLCHTHHTGGDDSIHKLGTLEFQLKHGIPLKRVQNTLLINYLRLVKNRK